MLYMISNQFVLALIVPTKFSVHRLAQLYGARPTVIVVSLSACNLPVVAYYHFQSIDQVKSHWLKHRPPNGRSVIIEQ